MKKRVYNSAIEAQFGEDRQMLFLMGPRQVGKTTASLLAGKKEGAIFYFNCDNFEHRTLFAKGIGAIAQAANLTQLQHPLPTLIFDEIHKAPQWKAFLKGFFDGYGQLAHILVTGSARLDVYQKGGDSLMGRYFRYRLHPLSVAELITSDLPNTELRPPKPLDPSDWETLLLCGGFPEPFTKGTKRFYTKWQAMRRNQVFREDLRDLSYVHELAQLELLAELIRMQAGSLSNYNTWAKHIRISADTVRRWIELLKAVFYCFPLKPWTKNIGRSLLKEPKFYLYDWAQIEDEGARFENLIACHLLKAVHFWSDLGLGEYGLYYLRTKDKREVDFCITKNGKAWILIEAKVKSATLSPHLAYFQKQTKAKYALQVVRDLDYVEASCFERDQPLIVPAKTFLSQLV